jgi:hypothetical protein
MKHYGKQTVGTLPVNSRESLGAFFGDQCFDALLVLNFAVTPQPQAAQARLQTRCFGPAGRGGAVWRAVC